MISDLTRRQKILILTNIPDSILLSAIALGRLPPSFETGAALTVLTDGYIEDPKELALSSAYHLTQGGTLPPTGYIPPIRPDYSPCPYGRWVSPFRRGRRRRRKTLRTTCAGARSVLEVVPGVSLLGVPGLPPSSDSSTATASVITPAGGATPSPPLSGIRPLPTLFLVVIRDLLARIQVPLLLAPHPGS